ncbi:MAG: hypothetical protein JEZ06_11425 [Anaerolineaceae bacterium]|nr:hypothetical protein [Anaerolineaceae bacterium]
MNKTLIFGFGNYDREDDGVAWHILKHIANHFDISLPEEPQEEIPVQSKYCDFFFMLQLMPEMAEMISEYDRVCFVDAHTGIIDDDIFFGEVKVEFQSSPLTHHFTPSSCMSLCKNLYHKEPEAILTSVRGYSFDFSHGLSEKTSNLALDASKRIIDWILLPQ